MEFKTTSINQMEGESRTEWCIRLMYCKAHGGFADTSWKEIMSILGVYGDDSHFASKSRGVQLGIDFLTNMKTDIDIKTARQIERIEKSRIEMEQEKIAIQDKKNRVSRILREGSRINNVYKELADDVSIWLKNNPIPLTKYTKGKTKKEMLLLLSDWHWGVCESNNINFVNETILDERVNEITNQVIEYARLYHPNKLHIFILGDMINGLIHLTTRMNSEQNCIEQTQNVANKLINMIRTLVEHVPRIVVYGVRGNHCRAIANIKEYNNESFYDFIHNMLHLVFDGSRDITVVDNMDDKEIIGTKICGKNIFAMHGDKDKIKRVADDMTRYFSTIPDYVFMGHLHHNETLEVGRTKVVMNGSLCGIDEYAKNKRIFSKPSQSLIVLDDNDYFAHHYLYCKAGVKYSNEKKELPSY